MRLSFFLSFFLSLFIYLAETNVEPPIVLDFTLHTRKGKFRLGARLRRLASCRAQLP